MLIIVHVIYGPVVQTQDVLSIFLGPLDGLTPPDNIKGSSLMQINHKIKGGQIDPTIYS
jgi:hypothetical protein